jgi:hypothetical protein
MYIPFDDMPDDVPYFKCWYHLMGLSFNPQVDAFLHSYVEPADGTAARFNHALFKELVSEHDPIMRSMLKLSKADFARMRVIQLGKERAQRQIAQEDV